MQCQDIFTLALLTPEITIVASEEYLDAFFMAYTHFKVTPQQLLSQLASLYQNPPTSVVGTNAPLTPSVARTKITTFFSKWLSNPLQTDFNGTDAGVLDSYVKFINILKSDNVDIDSVRFLISCVLMYMSHITKFIFRL